MRILDLYCGAGLAADGYVQAGWEVVGVDLFEQPFYPGPFLRMNALELDQRFIRSFDAVHASPPCQFGTALRHAPGAKAHVNLIPATREILVKSGLPYVIENVDTRLVRQSMIKPVALCGSSWDLGVDVGGVRYHLQRHRLFETNWPLEPRSCRHKKPVVGVYGAHARVRAKSAGGRGTADFVGAGGHYPIMAAAMGVTRQMTCEAISQGFPPAYSKYVGAMLALHIARERAR